MAPMPTAQQTPAIGFRPNALIHRLSLLGAILCVCASFWLNTVYNNTSSSFHFGSLVVLQFSLLALCMLCAWRSAPDSAPDSRGINAWADVRWLLAVGIACRLLLIPLDHYTSNDMDRYLFDGKIALSGLDPYSINHNDPALADLKEHWAPPEEHTQYPTLYPPLALGLFVLAATADADTAPLVWKCFSTFAGILTLLIMAALLRDLGKLRHLPLIALSPLLLLETGVGAHVDAYSTLFVAAALYTYVNHRLMLVGFFIGLATLVKLLPIVLLLPLVLGQNTLHKGLRLGSSAIITVLAGYAAALLLGLVPIGSIGTLFEKWRFGSPLFALLENGLSGMQQTVTIALALLTAFTAIAYRAWRLPSAITLDSPLLVASAAVVLMLSPVVFPWYLMALVPLAAVAPRPFLIVWLCTLPLTYEVLGAFYAEELWQPATWPLILILLGFVASAVWSSTMVVSSVKRYIHWLHGQWPAGQPEKLPVVNQNLTTSIPGVYVVGDLTGIPLLKFAADSGARAINHLLEDDAFNRREIDPAIKDVVIIGAGIAGNAAAMQAKEAGLSYQLLESTEAFSTIKNFPAGKPIFTYPADMQPAGKLSLTEKESTRETLYQSVTAQIAEGGIEATPADVSHIEQASGHIAVVSEPRQIHKAHRVIIAIGKSGKFKTLDVPGENTAKVVNRLHDPALYADQNVAIVGGGDSALEAAIAIAAAQKNASALEGDSERNNGALMLVHRDNQFSRAKPENREAVKALSDAGSVKLHLQATVESIEEESLMLKTANGSQRYDNDAVLTLLGREAPLDFFRRSNLPIQGESTPLGWFALALFLVFVTGVYDWKNYGFLNSIWGLTTFPDAMPSMIAGLGAWWEAAVADRSTLLGTIAVSMKSRSFYYTVLYTACIGYFGWRRIARRKTPYIRLQTWCLFLIQCIPLFILPEIILPWLGYNGAFDAGVGQSIANSLFPSYISAAELAAQAWPDWGHPRAYWHAYGFILAWPLSVYNVFTPSPMMGWLIICFIQTFVLIPALIYRYGKGAYCGWICSCGALAETMGDTQRHKMPHGAAANRWNLVGQVLLAIAFVLLALRIYGWVVPQSWAGASFDLLLKGENSEYALVNPVSWKWSVDVLMGGILGVGLYFKYSGRVWCRFACPLAALMNIYARFSRFRILANKDKCISCNQCTSICHQGIDVMAFANQGKPMEDPQCVRCSACVEVCPTGVLAFGEVDRGTNTPIRYDKLQANRLHTTPVEMFEPNQVSK